MTKFFKIHLGRLAPWLIRGLDCPIVMYHRVLPSEAAGGVLDSNLVVSPQSFESNILFLLKNFSVVSLADIIAGKRTEKPSCVVTFDDGWIDTYRVAYPILKRLGVPATVFLPTAHIGTRRLFWYDRLEQLVARWHAELPMDQVRSRCAQYFMCQLSPGSTSVEGVFYATVHALKVRHPAEIESWLSKAELDVFGGPNRLSSERQLMDWDEVRTMGMAGITFGSHGVTHSILSTLSYEEQKLEIVESRRELLAQRINYVDCISFPNGNYNQDTLDLSAEAGYQMCVSASTRPCGTGMSRRLAHRIGVPASLSRDERLLSYALVRAKWSGRLYRIVPS